MVRERICGDIWFRVWRCNLFGINEVLDGMAKAYASVGAMAVALVEFAELGRVMVFR